MVRVPGPIEISSVVYQQQWQASRSSRRRFAATIRGRVRADLDLRGVNLAGADLSGATLIRVNLSRANLENSNLSGADMADVELEGAKLRGAHYDSRTRWPHGFDPMKAGAVLVK